MNPTTRILAASGAVILLLAAGSILWLAGLPQVPSLTTAPEFEALTLENERLAIDPLLNRPVVINFWATWCVPCVIEMPRLEDAHQKYQARGLLVVGVNVGEDRATVAPWIAEHDVSFPIVLDRFGELEQAYEVRGYPTTFFVDRQGRVQKTVQGLLSEDELDDGLAAIGIDE
ncbi:MAG: TlpA family protein disulfide reductase [Chloroflexi bacterium]|nr:TlpA family protein disulfide reductase [Chloroflexota bacterium]